MCGCRSSLNREMANKIYKSTINKEIAFKYNLNSQKGPHQYFLADKIYPLNKDNSVIHDSYLRVFKDSESFPSKRSGYCFVGGVSVYS